MKIIFMGTPDFAVTTLKALYEAGHEIVLAVTQPDKPRGRKGTPLASPVKEWAVDHGIQVFQPDRIRRPDHIAFLRKYEADICVVAAFGQILPPEILAMPKYGCVNVHASLLPKYRGAAPIQWAILNGDRVTGVTTMQMGVGLDDGDILEKEEVPIGPETTGGELFTELAEVGGRLAVRTLSDIEAGKVKPIPQDGEEATHVGMIKKSLGDLDWTKPAGLLHDYVRGLDPWPSAYTYYRGRTFKIWKAGALPQGTFPKGDPGQILSVTEDTVLVQTGEGILSLLEVQAEGKKRMSTADFLRGHALKEGETFSREREP